MISRFIPAGVRRLLGGKSASASAAKTKAPAHPPAIVAPGPAPAYQLIDRPGQLEPLLKALDRVDEVCLDTEADNMFHFRTRVCLLQFLVGKEIFLVDALAPIKFEPLWERLAKKHLVMHGSDFDIRLLHDFCRFRPKSIFDTMLAAQLLNRSRVGLAALLEDNFGVKLSKDSQKANWSRRPLTQKMLDYAALDVWYLPALRDLLTKELAQLKRLDWLDQQCRAQIESGLEGFAAPDENDWRIGRSERLRGRGLSVLHALWYWRQQTAERIDVPPFKVCSNDLLTKIAYAAEEGEAEAAILAQINLGKRHDRLLPSLTAALHAGFERDPASLPRRRGRDPNHVSLTQAEIEHLERIKTDRDRVAKAIGIEPTLIANRAQLAQIARAPRKLDTLLLPWQADLLRKEPSLNEK
ncbi:MAG: HRDC domain-containing protein [Verrucomicrobia bacterium]|nr:HRDC domain-containing protein [Verrucomicrobiota bacterium]